jgi:hypothetical protein
MTPVIVYSASDVNRLWTNVGRDGDPDACWPWLRSTNDKGYGRLMMGGKAGIAAHRAAWTVTNGPIPKGLNVLHRCDNPPCCNPAHLFVGTQADNNADRHAKGRTAMPTNGPDFWRNKTHCPHGHAYSGSNVRYRRNGCRYCVACSRERDRIRRKKSR